jgi:hypothetical protein
MLIMLQALLLVFLSRFSCYCFQFLAFTASFDAKSCRFRQASLLFGISVNICICITTHKGSLLFITHRVAYIMADNKKRVITSSASMRKASIINGSVKVQAPPPEANDNQRVFQNSGEFLLIYQLAGISNQNTWLDNNFIYCSMLMVYNQQYLVHTAYPK